MNPPIWLDQRGRRSSSGFANRLQLDLSNEGQGFPHLLNQAAEDFDVARSER